MDNTTTKNSSADPTTDSTVFCTKCGFRMNEQFDFCPKCGTKAAVISTEDASKDQDMMNEQPDETTKKEKRPKKKIIKSAAVVLAVICAIAIFCLCFFIRDIEVQKNMYLVMNQSAEIQYKIIPESKSNVKISFSSSDDNIVTVSDDGKVFAKSNGKCEILVSARGIKKTINVEVGNSSNNGSSKFEYAYNTFCDPEWAKYGGSYLSIDSNPNDESFYSKSNDAIAAVKRINTYLGIPGSVWEKMTSTNSLDGRQSESHNGFTVSWKYHPSNGLEVIYETDNK